jgi:hypothetical protein
MLAINFDIRDVIFENGGDIDLRNRLSAVARCSLKEQSAPLGTSLWKRRSTSKSAKPQHKAGISGTTIAGCQLKQYLSAGPVTDDDQLPSNFRHYGMASLCDMSWG